MSCKKIGLFQCLMATRNGGVMTYTAHLMKAFRALGYDPVLFRVTKRYRPDLLPYTHGEHYQDLTVEGAKVIAQTMPSIVTYVEASRVTEAIDLIKHTDAVPVLHDTADMEAPLLVASLKGRKAIAIRRAGERRLRKLGVNARFIPHPYVRREGWRPQGWFRREHDAICATRVDWRKHTEIVCAANAQGMPHIPIYGAVNRMFAFGTLDKRYPGWRANYRGVFPPGEYAAIELLQTARCAVDLTDIGGGWDGGGSQYAFLEAWEAQCMLIVNAAWCRDGDEVRHEQTAVGISNARELSEALAHPGAHDIVEAGTAQLGLHSADHVIPKYLEVLS